MNFKEAVDTLIIDTNEVILAKQILDESLEKTKDYLSQRIEEAFNDSTAIDKEKQVNISKLLTLSAKYKVGAFSVYLKLLKNNDKLNIKEWNDIVASTYFVHALVYSISSSNELEQLRNLFLSNKLYSNIWFTVFNSIELYYSLGVGLEHLDNPELTKECQRRQLQLRAFYDDVVSWADNKYQNNKNATNNSDDDLVLHSNIYNILRNISTYCISRRCNDITDLLNNLVSSICGIITTSNIDNRYSFFKEYIYLLNILAPKKYYDVIRASDCFRSLWKTLYEEDIFNASTIEDVGRNIYDEVKFEVGCNDDVLKIAIQLLHLYPYNKRSKPTNLSGYYQEIAAYFEIHKVPRDVYSIALNEYDKVYEAYEEMINRINRLQDQCTSLIEASNTKENSIYNCKVNKNLLFDISALKKELNIEFQKRKELESLYCVINNNDNDTDSADSFFEYCKRSLKELFVFFIEGTKDSVETSNKLKKLTLSAIRNTKDYQDYNRSAFDIEDYFRPYYRTIERFRQMIDDDPYTTARRLRYTIKFFPFSNFIQEKYKCVLLRSDNKDTMEYQKYLDEIHSHPLNVESLMKVNDIKDYLKRLKEVSEASLNMITKNIQNSLCFSQRKHIINEIVSLYRDKRFDIVINMIPIQVEGLLIDYIDNSLIYKIIDSKSSYKLSSYQKNHSRTFRKKALLIENEQLNLGFYTIAYFKYYFSSVYRNTVAHGNYTLLFYNMIDSDLSEDQACELIATELILDLNYLIDVMSKSNELDEAKRYLSDTCLAVTNKMNSSEDKSINEDVNKDDELELEKQLDSKYYRLYLDLIGKSRYNAGYYYQGFSVIINPMQILFWIFNPEIECYVGKDLCQPVRDAILSDEFWNYVTNKLENGKKISDKNNFLNLIRSILSLIDKDNLAFKNLIKAKNIVEENL